MLLRCLNAKCRDDEHGKPGHDFEADVPVCDKCGVDARQPRMANIIVRRVLIHLDPPHGVVAGMGKGYPACDPTRKVVDLHRTGEQATGEPGAVTCAKCKASAEWPKEWVEMDLARVPPVMPGIPCCG